MRRTTLTFSIISSLLMSFALHANQDVEWSQYGLDFKEQRYSHLDQINKKTINQLGLAWYFDTYSNRGVEATPIVVDGVMYATGSWSIVYALDARTGKLLWHYDPKVPREWGQRLCCDVVNRGVAIKDGKVVFGTIDARLISLNAEDGSVLWEVQTANITERSYSITGAPRIAKGKVYIGNGGAEFGVRGFVSAYDLYSGDLVWRFYTVPGNPDEGFGNEDTKDGINRDIMKQAAKTWTGTWWEWGGGGTVWDSIVYDEELDQLYIGVGNGSPWNRNIRSPEGGDNLFLSSIVALNPDTGKYIWHYQETPAESWDYTASQHIMLADMPWQGKTKKVIWHAPKNGFFFVIDRITGKPLSIEAYTNVNWAEGYDITTGRPIETTNADYKNGAEFIRPWPLGAHNWQPMAHSPQTGLVYIPAMDGLTQYVQGHDQYVPGQWNTGVGPSFPPINAPALQQKLLAQLMKGSLLAWDPQKQKAAWNLEHKYTWNGGLLATAGGLVFQGTAEGELIAVDAAVGNIVWRYPTQVGVIAPPVTFSLDGEQHIAIMAGWGGAFGLLGALPVHYPVPPSRVLVFKLNANAQLPPKNVQIDILTELPPKPEVSSDIIDRGLLLYDKYCYVCHGSGLNANHAVPDLRTLPMPFYENWDAIVLDGAMRKAGMEGFSGVLSQEDSRAIYAYVINSAYDLRELQSPSILTKIKLWFYQLITDISDSLQHFL